MLNTTATPTHCPYCALQCGMNVLPGTEGPTVEGRAEFPVNQGALCGKGQSAASVLSSQVRLTEPLVRSPATGRLTPATWEEALDKVADGLARARTGHGPDACGVFGGGGLTNEKAYALGKFARIVLGTSQIDYNGRFCMSSAAAAGQKAFGLDRGLPFPLEDIPRTGCVILVGSNLAETMPPALRYLSELKANGGTLIVIDPRRTRTADQADLHLAPRPGTDLALALGMLHLVVAGGRVDEEYVRGRTQGWEEARSAAMAHWPEYVERVTGVPVPQLREAVGMFTAAERAMVLTARGPEQQSKGTDTVGAWINLALATGRPGRPYSGYGCLTGQGNGQGVANTARRRTSCPATASSRIRRRGRMWRRSGGGPGHPAGPRTVGVRTPRRAGRRHPGAAADGLEPSGLRSARGARRVPDPLPGLPGRRRCRPLRDRRTGRRGPAGDAVGRGDRHGDEPGGAGAAAAARPYTPPGVRTDLYVLQELAARLAPDLEKGFPTDAREVFDELRRASAGGPADYSGISYDRLAEGEGVFWPYSSDDAAADADGPGTPRLFLERFATEDGRARFVPVAHRPAAEEPDAEYPLYLTTGRVVAQYQSGAQTRRVPELNKAAPGAFVELHPRLAGRIGVAQGDVVAVTSRRGRVEAPARLTSTIRPDTLFMPFHWPGRGGPTR